MWSTLMVNLLRVLATLAPWASHLPIVSMAESVFVKFSGRLDSSLIVYVSADPYAGVMMNDCEGTDVFQWNYST